MKKGFTLLEMMIVVSILAVLFLLSTPNIRKVMNLVEKRGCEAQLKVVDSAIIEYKLETGEYPQRISDLVSAGFLTDRQALCSSGSVITIVNGQAVTDDAE